MMMKAMMKQWSSLKTLKVMSCLPKNASKLERAEGQEREEEQKAEKQKKKKTRMAERVPGRPTSSDRKPRNVPSGANFKATGRWLAPSGFLHTGTRWRWTWRACTRSHLSLWRCRSHILCLWRECWMRSAALPAMLLALRGLVSKW